MSALAKKCRSEMEAKARRLVGEKDQKVDSSNWSPAKPLNTEKKTGLQPLGERMARKSGGRVEGEKAVVDAYVNRDVKAANAKAEGKPHDGGMKKGGKVDDKRAKLADKMKGGQGRESRQGLRGLNRPWRKAAHEWPSHELPRRERFDRPRRQGR